MVKVERGMMIRKVLPLVLLSAFALTGCGDDDKKKDDDATSEYVVMPFVLGDTATINGGTADTFTFKLDTSGGAASSGAAYMLNASEAPAAIHMTPEQYDHQLRLLLNRYDPALGLDQGAWFWKSARRLDAYKQMVAGRGPMQLFANGSDVGPVETFFQKAVTRPVPTSNKAMPLTAATCPTDELQVSGPAADVTDGDAVAIPAGKTVDGGDYCLVFIDDPVTAGTAAQVEATVKAAIARYKTVIYKDTFAPIGDYTFKPIIAVIDFGDASKWPADVQISGAFISSIATILKQPILYMASDFKKLEKNKDTPEADYDKALNTRLWHSTIAHELQHAFMDYYKVRKAGLKGEVPIYDEGIAHYMQDLFGYGAENFEGFQKLFLAAWSDKDGGAQPFLHASDDTDFLRGAAHTFFYYLVSQKGGIEFANGAPTGGGGLDFVASLVKSSKIGAANLAEVYGGTWTDAVAGFYGALVLDGAKLNEGITAEAVHKVQEPETMTDLQGNADKKYGMHFNGFSGVTDSRAYELKLETTPQFDGTFYASSPILYTGASVDSVKATLSDTAAKNQGIAKVKIK